MRAEGIEPEKDRATQMPPNNSLIMGGMRKAFVRIFRYSHRLKPVALGLPSDRLRCGSESIALFH